MNRYKNWIDQRGNRTALVDFRWGTISWQGLGERVDRAVQLLCRMDLSIPIAHRCENNAEDVITAIAIAELRGIESPIDHRTPPREFNRRVQLLGGQVLTRDEKHRFLTDSSLEKRQPANAVGTLVETPSCDTVPGIILWTSGTTSTPRGVHLSHEAWLGNAAAKLEAVPQSPEDIRLTVLPISHAYARTCDLGTWLLSGSTLAITLGWEGLLDGAPRVHPTLINCVPSIADRLLGQLESNGLDRLRLLGVGGAALSKDSYAQWKARGVTVIQGYGMTETGPVICSATPENSTPGLVGDFVSPWQWRIVDRELHVRGPYAMEGYWQQDQATQKKRDPEGWIRTGDHVEWVENQQQLRVLGRLDDVIVLDNGMKLFPSEIERQIQQCRGVVHAMIVKRSGLELWVDGHHVDEVAVGEVLSKHKVLSGHALQCAIHYLDPPLSIEKGELTTKQTICRNQIMHRFQ